MSPGLRNFCHDVSGEAFKLFVAPGEDFGKSDRREIEGVLALIRCSGHPLQHVELEFSASPRSVFKAASGLPEDYPSATIEWALSVCRSVVICADIAPGAPGGEPYRRLAGIQASFHCAPDQVAAWAEYLGRRVKPIHQFAVVRFENDEVTS